MDTTDGVRRLVQATFGCYAYRMMAGGDAMGELTGQDLTRHGRRLRTLQGLLGIVTAAGFAVWVGSLRPGGVYSAAKLPVALGFSGASIVVLWLRIRNDGRQTGEPWFRAATVTRAAGFWCTIAAIIGVSILGGFFGNSFSLFWKPARVAVVFMSAVWMGLIGARIVITNRLLAEGGGLGAH